MTEVATERRPRLATALALSLVMGANLLLSGCDCRAKVIASSTVLGDVRVQIAGGGGLCGGTPGVGDFEVYRGPEAGELVWAGTFSGSNNYPAVQELKYGTPPPGFTEANPAAPLRANDALEFRVHGPGFRGGVQLTVTTPP